MRRKSTRNAQKATPEKPPKEAEPPKARRSRRRKRSPSKSSDSEEEVVAVKKGPEPEVTPDTTTKSHTPTDEETEEPVWKVTSSDDTTQGEVHKLKICLSRPSESPDKNRSRRSKSNSQTEDDATSSEDKSSTRRTRSRGSPFVRNDGLSSQEGDEDVEEKKGKGKSKGKHKSNIEKSPQLISEPEIQTNNEISENVQVTPQSPSIDKPVDNENDYKVDVDDIQNVNESAEEQGNTGEDSASNVALDVSETVINVSVSQHDDDKQSKESDDDEALCVLQKNASDDRHSESENIIEEVIVYEDVVTISEEPQEIVEISTHEEVIQESSEQVESEKELHSSDNQDQLQYESITIQEHLEAEQIERMEVVEEKSSPERIIAKEVVLQHNSEESVVEQNNALIDNIEVEQSTISNENISEAKVTSPPGSPKEVPAESLKDSPDSPKEDSPESPKEDSPESAREDSPKSPKEISPTSSKEVSSESLKEVSSELSSGTEKQQGDHERSSQRRLKRNNESFRPEAKVEEEGTEEPSYIKPSQSKRKWEGGIHLTPSLTKIDLDSIQSVWPSIDFPEEPDLYLEPERERRKSTTEPSVKKVERKVSVEYKSDSSDKPTYEKQSSVSSITQDSEDNANIIAFNRKISIVDDTASKLKPPPSPAKNPLSDVLFITNLVRPFTLKQLKELLERTGKIQEEGFWTDRIKSKCYVQYETEEEAEATRNALHGVQWPIGNGKKLIIDYATAEDLKNAKNPPAPPPVVLPPDIKASIKENLEPVEVKARNEEKVSKEVEKKRNEGPVREWDIGKKDVRRERSRSRERSRKHRRSPTPPDDFIIRKQRKAEESIPQKLMDDLFLKTKTTPSIYWQPLSPEEISLKQQQRLIRMEEHKRRLEETSRMKGREMGRGAFRRRYD